jgi:hypothetical protein
MVIPAMKGVRLHDLRHTAAVLWLTAGVHFIQVAKWLGHSSYVLTLTTYADYIPDVETENPLHSTAPELQVLQRVRCTAHTSQPIGRVQAGDGVVRDVVHSMDIAARVEPNRHGESRSQALRRTQSW